MFTLFKHEMKLNLKTLLIWTFSVGGMCFACILLFSGLEESMADIADSMSQMGAFSQAFGMTQLSIATISGFYAAEIGTIHALGGAMFAAMIGAIMLSKEEDGHTSEFLFTLPISRVKAIGAKYIALVSNIVLFNVLCVISYVIGFEILGEGIETKEFLLYHLMQVLMQVEIGSICFFVSSCVKKNKIGSGIAVALLLYVLDLMGRVLPDLEKFMFLSPFSYANAADIFSVAELEWTSLAFGILITVAAFLASLFVYRNKDLAA